MLVSALLAGTAYAIMSTTLVDERNETALRQAFTNARLLRPRLEPRPEEMGTLLASLEVGTGGGSIVELGGRWFTSSIELDRARVPASLRELVDGGDAGIQQVRGDPSAELVVGVPIAAAGARYYELTSFAETEAALSTMRTVLALGALGATALGALVGVVLSGRILAPLRDVAAVATEIVDGKTSTRLDASGDADLAPLTDSFNDMLDTLDERIESEAAFASDVSHELRGPLTTLSSAVEVVNRRRASLPSDVVDAVDALDEQVHAFNDLVLDLLEISRLDAGTATLDRQVLDLCRVCAALVEDRGTPVPVECDGVSVVADPRRLGQVLVNLLDNADRYGGGAVALSVRRGDACVRIVVDDAGPGVPASERDAVFGRFVRGAVGRRAGTPGGTGLGLSLSRRHVELHGGSLWVEDRPGGGARFVVELPDEGSR